MKKTRTAISPQGYLTAGLVSGAGRIGKIHSIAETEPPLSRKWKRKNTNGKNAKQQEVELMEDRVTIKVQRLCVLEEHGSPRPPWAKRRGVQDKMEDNTYVEERQ